MGKMMRVCDYIAEYVYKAGAKDVFMVSGGGLMFLTDGLACNEQINAVCCHHEQAVAMAATAYAKYHGFGCGYVTTGCGGTNAITGVLNAWQDNTPCLFISGQCKRKETIRNCSLPLRQLGVQEADIVRIVDSITKYAVMINFPEDVAYHMEKAEYLAKTGRPGPVWIDVPMDVQSAVVDVDELRHFNVEAELYHKVKTEITEEERAYIVEKLEHARRPVIIAGQGVRLAGIVNEFSEFVHMYDIPVVCSRMGLDVLPTEDELNIGRIGNKGTRAANFAVQNADLVLALGSRLSVSSTGQEYEYFAREAEVIAVDIDEFEHMKGTVKIDRIINGDLRELFEEGLTLPEVCQYSGWAKRCLEWKEQYPVCLPEYYEYEDGIDLYVFMNELSKCLKEDPVVVTDAGSAVYVPAQAIKTTTKKQRYITSGAQAEMGFTLPAAIGVCVARGKKETIGITGDGSLQMNIQELQTVAGNRLPVKLFVWNNDGYLSIRATQNKFFEGRFIGTDKTSGVTFPDLEKIADAYGLQYKRIDSVETIGKDIEQVLASDGPVVCEVMCRREQVIQPTVSSKQMEDGRLVSAPIEDMFPFLPREEFEANMIVDTVKY